MESPTPTPPAPPSSSSSASASAAKGKVVFPPSIPSLTSKSFISLTTLPSPVIAYSQKTWKLHSGEPMHSESGYWRPRADGTIEVVIAQSTGLVEVLKGDYDAEEKVIRLQSELVGNASEVEKITRVFQLIGGDLSYVVQMATNATSLQPHLKASLKKL
ncbi:hypothetical protein ACJW31_11G002300 [Castanea mollissima]